MTEIDNDKLLRDFFAENKQEIADNGFSRRVMHHLPGRSNHLARIWSAFVMTVAAVLFVWLGGLEAAWGTIREVFIGMINHGTTGLDPKSIIIAAVVLLLWLHERLLLWHKQNKYRLKVQSISFPDFYLYESKNSLSLSFSVKQ